MPTAFGDDGEGSEVDRIVGAELWGGRDNPFHTNFEGGYDGAMEEIERNERANLSLWDSLITSDEIGIVAEMDPIIQMKCPQLQLAPGSTFFYYCGAYASKLVAQMKGGLKFAGRGARKVSAEFGAHCTPEELEAQCLGCFNHCEYYQAAEEDLL
jgi:hypothetical protein